MTDPKFDSIETALMHQEKQIQDLNDMVNAQWQEIDRLKNRLDLALGKLSALETATPDQNRDLSVAEIAALEKPPHY